MCGIIGYIGKKNDAIPILIDGLKKLEYRGYDSAGIAYLNGSAIEVVKAVGPIANLEVKVDRNKKSNIGIGHTRWATHGVPNEINSHPHISGAVTIVHNGIIENYIELKKNLLSKGVTFVSDTDTEVAAALLDYLYKEKKDAILAIEEFEKLVNGSYAIVAVFDQDFEHLYVLKKLSPLIVGIGENEKYIASDVPAIINKTDKYITLEDGDFAIVSADDIRLFDELGNKKTGEVKIFKGDAMSLEKGEYDHFMLKEIHEEPSVFKNLINQYMTRDKLAELPDLRKFRSINIVACGSAMHAGLVGKYFIEKNLNVPVTVELASEFKYKKLFLNKEDVVVAISQSGETADTLAAVKIARSIGAHTIGIVNVKESSIAREVDEVVYTLAGSEIAVATTKAYLAQVAVLLLISYKCGIKSDVEKELLKTPLLMNKLINEPKNYLEIAKIIKDHEDVFFIGRQIDYAICMEASLKLKEISYIHSEAYAAGELKHGTISLIKEGTPVFVLITDKNIAEKTISNAKEVKARGAYVILVVSEKLNVIGDFYDKKLVIPSSVDEISTFLSVIPFQLIAYEVAKLRGCSIDKPRNLAKSVTVE